MRNTRISSTRSFLVLSSFFHDVLARFSRDSRESLEWPARREAKNEHENRLHTLVSRDVLAFSCCSREILARVWSAHYNQMKFILPALSKRKGPDGIIRDTSTDPLQGDEESSVESENDAADETQNANTTIPESPKDEDKKFLLSLLPLYKSMKKDAKLVGRIKMLEALRNVMQENCYDSVKSNQNSYDDNITKATEDGQGTSTEITNRDDDVSNSPNFSPESDVKNEPSYPFMLESEDDPLLTPNEDSSPPPTKKHRSEHQKQIMQNSIPVVSPAPSTTSTSDDIFEAIGKNVAHKLRRMVQQQRIIAEKIIGDVMYHGQMEMLTVNSHLTVDK